MSICKSCHPAVTWISALLAGFGVTACNGSADLRDDLVDSQYCDGSCDIVLDTLAQLGDLPDSISPAFGARAVRMSNGEFILAPTDHPGVLAVYSANGNLLRTFGKPGRGPDEYDTEFLQLYRRGDSIIIVDASNLRLTVVDTLGRSLRSHSVPGALHTLVPLGTRFIAQADVRTPDKLGFLLHELDSAGSIVRSHVEIPAYRNEADGFRPVAAASDGGIWLANRTEYRLEHYDSLFMLTNTITPRPSWFRTPSSEVNIREERPEPLLGTISHQSDGLLWAIIIVADPKWKPQPRTNREQKIDTAWFQRMIAARDWVLDVVDPESGDRIASKRFDGPIGFGSGDNLLYSTSVGENGQMVVTAMSAALLSRAKGGQ